MFEWNAQTGEQLGHFDLGRCGGVIHDLTDSPPGGERFVDEDVPCMSDCDAADRVPVFLIDRHTGEQTMLTENRNWHASLSGDGRRAAFDDLDAEPGTSGGAGCGIG